MTYLCNSYAALGKNFILMEEEIKGTENKTRNTGLLLNLIALAGLAVLYILYFTGGDRDTPAKKSSAIMQREAGAGGELQVAFVNTDKILDKYLLVKKLSKELQAEEDKREKQIADRQKAYEKDAAYFQEQVQRNTISESSAQTIYEQLMQEQQGIMDMHDQFNSELAQKEFDMNTVLLDSISNYLERMNSNGEFDYILSSNRGGSILFAKDAFDITQEVIDGLNADYSAKFPEKGK